MEKIDLAGRGNRSKERKRIPMSVPVQRLEVDPIPGYHLHWFINSPERIARALDGGYEFVEERETQVNSVSLGGESAQSGNTDLGSRVTIVSGQEIGKDGQPTRLVLMKIKQEWHEEDLKLAEQGPKRVAEALRGGTIGHENDKSGDTAQRYVDKSRTRLPDLFTPKRSRAA